MPDRMLEVICNVPGGRYRGGMRHTAGRKLYPLGTFTAAQIEEFQSDAGFEINEVEPAAEVVQPDELSLEDAIFAAAEVLAPVAEDYGVDINDISIAITAVFSEAQAGKEEAADGQPFDDVVEATRTLMNDEPREERKFAGDKPKTRVLSEIVGWRVTGQERDRAFALVNKD